MAHVAQKYPKFSEEKLDKTKKNFQIGLTFGLGPGLKRNNAQKCSNDKIEPKCKAQKMAHVAQKWLE